MRLINILLVIWPFLCFSKGAHLQGSNEKSLFVCYGKIDPNSIVGYKLVVLEAGHFNDEDIRIFKKNNEKVIAYISLTEVNENSPLFNKLKSYCIGENTNWGSRFVNISDERAKKVLLSRIGKLENHGFDGLFLDNLDNVSSWGALNGMENELVELLQTIKRKYPQFYLCQNSGLFLDAQLSSLTDAIVLESLVTNYDFQKQEYLLRDETSKNRMLQEILSLRKSKDKPIYILEYSDNFKIMEKVTKELITHKLPYYIAQIDLQHPSQFLMLNK